MPKITIRITDEQQQWIKRHLDWGEQQQVFALTVTDTINEIRRDPVNRALIRIKELRVSSYSRED